MIDHHTHIDHNEQAEYDVEGSDSERYDVRAHTGAIRAFTAGEELPVPQPDGQPSDKHHEKVSVVGLAHAATDPGTMVVKFSDTQTAILTMFSSPGLQQLAMLAPAPRRWKAAARVGRWQAWHELPFVAFRALRHTWHTPLFTNFHVTTSCCSATASHKFGAWGQVARVIRTGGKEPQPPSQAPAESQDPKNIAPGNRRSKPLPKVRAGAGEECGKISGHAAQRESPIHHAALHHM